MFPLFSRQLKGTLITLVMIGSYPFASLPAQDVPVGVEPWRLVRILIEQTGSPYEEIDRTAFLPRLGGRLAGLDPESLRGRWERYVDVKIDTLILLSPRLEVLPPDPQREIPARTDTIDRASVWATTFKGGNYDNSYFFLERDSIWRIVEIIEFPTRQERSAIVREADLVDTTHPDYIIRRRNVLNLLHHDIIHRTNFRENYRDLSDVSRILRRSSDWGRIELGMIPIDSLDPFAPLDLPPKSERLLLHRLNPRALNRLFSSGISRIVRSGRTIRFEIGRFGGRSVGYLQAPDGSEMTVDQTGDFLLSPLDEGWWFYKSFHTPESSDRPGFTLPDDLFVQPDGIGSESDAAERSSGRATELEE